MLKFVEFLLKIAHRLQYISDAQMRFEPKPFKQIHKISKCPCKQAIKAAYTINELIQDTGMITPSQLDSNWLSFEC